MFISSANLPAKINTSRASAPIVLLHSSGTSGRQWRKVTQNLGAGCRIFTPDLFGYGSRDWPADAPQKLAVEAQNITRMIQKLDRPVHLVGHSYGGAVALRVALEETRLVRSLTLIESVAFYLLRDGNEEDRSAFREISDIADSVHQAAANPADANGMRSFVEYWNGEGVWRILDVEKRREINEMAPVVARNFLTTMWENVPATAFARMTAPTVIVRGAQSTTPAIRIASKLCDILPKSSLITYPDAGHMLPNSHPHQIAGVISQMRGCAVSSRRKAG